MLPSRNDKSTGTFERSADFLCILAGYLSARYLAAFLNSKGLFVFAPRSAADYSTLLLLTLFCWTGVSTYTRFYDAYGPERLDAVTRQLLRTIVLWGLMCTGGAYFLKLANLSRQFTIYVIVFSSVLMFTRQVIATVVQRRLSRFGQNWRTALVIGERTACELFAKVLAKTVPTSCRVVSVVLSGKEPWNVLESLHARLPEADDAFIISGAKGTEALALRFLKQGKRVHVVPELLDAQLYRQALESVGGIPVVSLWNGRLGWPQAALKRAADITGSLILFVLLWPLLGIFALAIKCTSPGPVLFQQRRIGRAGKPFTVLKFRTMVKDAERVLKSDPVMYAEYVANNFKLPKGQDSRITRLGAFMRATSLDELPQLLNVLKGDMSLVGPRPVVPGEVANYGDYATLLLSAKPGMTGHWQVNGRSEVEEYAKRVELDLEYIRDQSLGRDFKILLQTVPAVLLRRGAH